MPNNFRLTGNYYVSKEGSDSNDGLTAETPLLTIQAALNKITTAGTYNIVIGSGVYKENLSRVYTAFAITISLLADGYVVIEPVNPTDTIEMRTASTAAVFRYVNIEFRNGRFNFFGNNSADQQILLNCILKNTQVTVRGFANSLASSGYGGAVSFINTEIINTTIFCNNAVTGTDNPAGGSVNIDTCILINSSVTGTIQTPLNVNNLFINAGAYMLRNSYVDANSTVQFNSFVYGLTANGGGISGFQAVFPTSNLVNNNIQGKLSFPWLSPVSGSNAFLVPLTLAQALIEFPTYNRNSISADPLFNDPRNLNFTLQAGSPHIKAASDGSNIGGTEYAVYKAANSTEFTTGATVSGLTLRGNDSYTITSSPAPGTIETAPIFLQWPAAKPLTKLEWAGSLEFNKSVTAGTFGNNNVPDWDTYTTGAGASPDRLTVRMRFSTQQSQPTLSSHWDNGGYWTAGNYELFEVNSKPKVDSNGKGNGNPDYIESSGLGDLVPTWIQLSIKLIDNYNP